jgi:hypothetical protein
MHKREEIIAAIKKLSAKLGRAPSQAEFRRACKISWYQIYKDFRGMRQAVRAAGLEPGPRGGPLDVNALVLDWARVVRELGRLPSRAEYSQRGNHHAGTLHARIGWAQMPHKFVLLVKEFHMEREWSDVVGIVVRRLPLLGQLGTSSWQKPFTAKDAEDAKEEQRQTYHGGTETRRTAEMESNLGPSLAVKAPLVQDDDLKRGDFAPRDFDRCGMRLGKVVSAALAVEILMATMTRCEPLLVSLETSDSLVAELQEPHHGSAETRRKPEAPNRMLYGEPLQNSVMTYAPTNEAGVILLFGSLAAGMGFRIERLQAAFPDCKAKREVVPGKWEDVLIEFEYESRNFKEHRHDPMGCHAIVCWKHNWPDCPEWLEVIELCNEVM